MTTKYPHKDDWKFSDAILKDAVAAIKRRVKVDCTRDIPYVAGYSKDGKTIYIDCEIPQFMRAKNGTKLDVWAALTLHEAVEKALLDTYNLPYQLAHQIALRTEQDIVEASGVTWSDYNAWMAKWIKDVGSRKAYPNTPKNLDMTPYEDENDRAVMDKMS